MCAESKPWDHLRGAVTKPPMKPGCFEVAGAWVNLISVEHDGARISIGHQVSNSNYYSQYFQHHALRQLAEFCTELADQLEGKA